MSCVPMLPRVLDLVARGFRIIPMHRLVPSLVHPGTLRCACRDGDDCKRPGKHGPLARPRLLATTDPAKVALWWGSKQWRDVGVAAYMGHLDRIAIDVDGAVGRASLAELELQLGPLPVTLTQSTGRAEGGEHRVFTVGQQPHHIVERIRSRSIAPGIDIRSCGTYIVLAPSPHVTSTRYRWHDLDQQIAMLPDAWFDHLAASRRSSSVNSGATASDRPDDRHLPSIEECEDRALGYIRHRSPAIAGQRGHDALYDVALDLVRGFVIPPERAIELIDEHYNPRCHPAWSWHEIAHKVEDALASSEVGWAYHAGLVGDAQDEPKDGTESSPTASAPSGDGRRHGASPGPHTWRASSANDANTTADRDAVPDRGDRILIPEAPVLPDSAIYCGAEILDVAPGAILKLQLNDGVHTGRIVTLPLDWPMTARSSTRWRSLAHAVRRDEIRKPMQLHGERLRVEIVGRDGRLRVGRFYASQRSGAKQTATTT